MNNLTRPQLLNLLTKRIEEFGELRWIDATEIAEGIADFLQPYPKYTTLVDWEGDIFAITYERSEGFTLFWSGGNSEGDGPYSRLHHLVDQWDSVIDDRHLPALLALMEDA